MPRYRLHIAYHGKNFSGFQVQNDRVTIQQALEAALHRLLGEHTRVVPSGRTDAGVHALCQVAHFDVKSEKAISRISASDMVYKLNQVLDDNIAITSFKKVSAHFHARKAALRKVYVYHILNSTHANPFLKDSIWHIPKHLDVKAMKLAATFLLGRHDFSAFCASDSNAIDHVRTLTKINFTHRNPAPFMTLKGDQFLNVEFVGEGFLKQMVRILVGTLVDVGLGKLEPQAVQKIRASCDRTKASRTAPAHGLFLKRVCY